MNCPCCGQEKECSVCKESKPLGEFYPQKLGKFGRKAACKACYKLREMGYQDAVQVAPGPISPARASYLGRCRA